MKKVDTKEIVAVAHWLKWQSIKNFIKNIVKHTLKTDVGYVLVSLDVKLKGTSHPDFSLVITKIKQLKELDKIEDFSIISLYQSDGIINNHINISKEGNVIIVIAKYMGPDIKYAGTFDFSVQVDSINSPYFTNSSGTILSPKDLINLINKKVKPVKEGEVKKEVKEKEVEGDLEVKVFEILTGKNAIWGDSETKTFQKWKEKLSNKFRNETGKNAYYGGKITAKYKKDLENLLKSREPGKKEQKKEEIKENEVEVDLEKKAFEKITGKNAIWGGSETKYFQEWKEKTITRFRKKTRKNPYYKGKFTTNYKKYLENSKNL